MVRVGTPFNLGLVVYLSRQEGRMDMKLRLLSAIVLVLLVATVGTAAAESDHNFRAHLKGAAEVPPADTQAQGQAIFQFSEDGASLTYKLIVANINNVRMSHIHLAPPGENGPIVLWLYPSAPPAQLIPGRFQGVLAEGTVSAADLVGPLAGMSLADLKAAMQEGQTYVNVHTDQFPGGEIRGAIH
jgi:hypothetical protein